MAKKVVACSVAAALVASMSYFHLWGAPQAVADDTTVEVRFEIAQDGVKAKVGDKEFTSQTEESYQASTSADLNFTIEAESSDTEFAVSYVTEAATAAPEAQAMGSKQPGSGLVTTEEGENESEASEVEASDDLAEGDSADESADSEPTSTEEEIIYLEGAGAPIPETAAALQKKHEQESANDEKHAPATQNAEEEVVEEDATPMASGIDSVEADDADQQATVHAEAIVAENGIYTIDEAVLQQAGADNALVVVTIATTDSKQGNVSNWDDLVKILTGNADTNEAVLHEDITEATGTIAINGTKTLDLNGHDIKVESTGSLFTVGDKANFTITDSRDAAKAVKISSEQFDKLPTPADDPGAFKDMVGKTAEYGIDENGDLLLTYYKTCSYPDMPAKGQTEEYIYGYTLKLPAKGAIEATGTSNLVDVQKNGTLNIEGGRLTQTDGKSAIKVSNGKVVVNGGFLVGSRGESGAAINATNANITVEGDAIIAGNTAAGNSNGGAIYIDKSTLSVAGNALLAGNQAGDEVYCSLTKEENGPVSDSDYGKMSEKRNGGAIYAKSKCNVSISGDAIISGNTANADGGGIYVMGNKKNVSQDKSQLRIAGNAYITNNRSENDKSLIHFKERPHESKEVDWKRNGGGGGGIFTMADTEIDGGQLTGNFAADGGGAMMITSYAVYSAAGAWQYQYDYPLLTVKKSVLASNYAGTSEGGAIFAITHKDSKIHRGYITNNMTDTPFDYGGGGLFLSSATHGKETGLTVVYPLVTNNTARGFGGGVGICTNGIVVTADAAIYDNVALTKNATTNPNEYGDQWVLDKKYGLEGVALREEVDGVEQSPADDLFSAKKSVVCNEMLGGGLYNWKGYTTGGIAKGHLSMYREDWGNLLATVNNAGAEFKIGGNLVLNGSKNSFTLHVNNEYVDFVRGTEGWLLNYKNVLNGSDTTLPPTSGSAAIKTVTVEGDSSLANQKVLKLDVDLGSHGVGTKPTGLTLKDALPIEGKGSASYELVEVANFPKDESVKLFGDRLTFLKADPSPEAKEKARKQAVLFITGNYSNTNGGGIACNDRIAIGRDPEDEETPSKEPSSTSVAALQINKSLEDFDEANGSATAVFNVVGYRDKDAAERKVKDLEIYRNIVGFTFKAGEKSAEPRILEDIPEGWYVIEEISYSGDNFDDEQVAANKRIVQVKGVKVAIEAGETEPKPEDLEKAREEALDNAEENPVEFKNVYSEVPHYGTGVVNHYAKDDDGTFSYTPDANYADRTRELTTEEGM